MDIRGRAGGLGELGQVTEKSAWAAKRMSAWAAKFASILLQRCGRQPFDSPWLAVTGCALVTFCASCASAPLLIEYFQPTPRVKRVVQSSLVATLSLYKFRLQAHTNAMRFRSTRLKRILKRQTINNFVTKVVFVKKVRCFCFFGSPYHERDPAQPRLFCISKPRAHGSFC